MCYLFPVEDMHVERTYKMKTKICPICGKEFIPHNNHQKYCRKCATVAKNRRRKKWALEYNHKYYERHREELKAKSRAYYKQHRKEMNAKCREYYKKYREEAKEWGKEWRKKHPEKTKEINRKYYRSSKGKRVIRYHKSKRRQLGFNPLNKSFEDAEAHHINFNDVIYIPKELHRNIRHNLWNGKNMDVINKIAYQFLLGNYTMFEVNKKL